MAHAQQRPNSAMEQTLYFILRARITRLVWAWLIRAAGFVLWKPKHAQARWKMFFSFDCFLKSSRINHKKTRSLKKSPKWITIHHRVPAWWMLFLYHFVALYQRWWTYMPKPQSGTQDDFEGTRRWNVRQPCSIQSLTCRMVFPLS